MSPDRINEIKSLLKVKGDTNEGILKYSDIKLKMIPMMNLNTILIFVMLVASILGLIEILKLSIFIVVKFTLLPIVGLIYSIYGYAGRNMDYYKVVNMLENQKYDIDEIKKLLQIENVKDYSYAKRKCKIYRNVYILIGIVFGILAAMLIIDNIIGSFNLLNLIGVLFGIFMIFINIGIFSSFRDRQNIYSVGLILDEKVFK